MDWFQAQTEQHECPHNCNADGIYYIPGHWDNPEDGERQCPLHGEKPRVAVILDCGDGEELDDPFSE